MNARKPRAPSTATHTALITRADTNGRPVTITPAGVAVVEALAREGLHMASIAKRLGIGASAFRECRRRQEEVDEALGTGRAALSDECADRFLKMFRKGNITAGIYLTKTLLAWRENDAPEQRPNITIVLPGAQTEEAYMRTISAEALPAPAKKDAAR